MMGRLLGTVLLVLAALKMPLARPLMVEQLPNEALAYCTVAATKPRATAASMAALAQALS